MLSKSLSIGPRGQITLPKKIRDIFGGDNVIIQLIDDKHAIISPVEDVGGGLAQYAKNCDLPFDELREIAWKKSRDIK
jgi:bifunctional DNA-binding transcriptional regulator/antitoxin component of YhaV-PrlF toxin-antitoxin module